jgi:MoaA/NifB/PqqE/SkfB family radical SAM enzyme
MTLARRVATAFRTGALWPAISFRWRQLVYANSHRGEHYLKLGDAQHRWTWQRARGILRRLTQQPTSFSIDVVSVCNLECPTCPVANWPKAAWTDVKGTMDSTLLHQLLQKAISESVVGDVKLFAYSEPLLHPRLPELIAIVKSYGLRCEISTNLNVMRDAEALLRAEPDTIVISVSGFHQETYAVTHAGGNIETVKAHARLLGEAKARLQSRTDVSILFHKYLTNLDELPLMRDFAASIGVNFDESVATFFPLEKMLTHARPELALAEITEADNRIIERLAIPPREFVERASHAPVDSCTLQDNAVVLDVAGNVYLCCETAMDHTRNRIASYLDTPLDRIRARQRDHALCTICMAAGLPPSPKVFPGRKSEGGYPGVS